VVTGVTPGQSTPQAVVAGFIDASAQVRTSVACGYVVPIQQAACPALLGQISLGALPTITIGETYTQGTKAIVPTIGKICAESACVLNNNARLGLPANSAGFEAAYELAASRTSIGFAAFACLQMGNLWYVDLALIPHS
jgi:hypothetical protein